MIVGILTIRGLPISVSLDNVVVYLVCVFTCYPPEPRARPERAPTLRFACDTTDPRFELRYRNTSTYTVNRTPSTVHITLPTNHVRTNPRVHPHQLRPALPPPHQKTRPHTRLPAIRPARSPLRPPGPPHKPPLQLNLPQQNPRSTTRNRNQCPRLQRRRRVRRIPCLQGFATARV